MKTEITLLQFFGNDLKKVSLSEVLGYIKTGDLVTKTPYFDYSLKEATGMLKTLVKKGYEKYAILGRDIMPKVSFNGEITEQQKLTTYSNVTALELFEIDFPNNSMAQMMDNLKHNPCMLCMFKPPHHHSIKVLIEHDNNDPDKHLDLYDKIRTAFGIKSYGDRNELEAITTIYYDPNIWVNPNPKPFHYIP